MIQDTDAVGAARADHLTKLLQRFPKVNPWTCLSILMVVGIVGYFGFLGLRYWDASNEIQSLRAEALEFPAALRANPVDEKSMMAELQSEELRLGQLLDAFSHRTTGELIGLLYSIASSSGIELGSVVAGRLSSVEDSGIQYQTLPINITLRGDPAAIYEFLSQVREKEYAVAVGNIRIAGLDGIASAQTEFAFYMSPEISPDTLAEPASKR